MGKRFPVRILEPLVLGVPVSLYWTTEALSCDTQQHQDMHACMRAYAFGKQLFFCIIIRLNVGFVPPESSGEMRDGYLYASFDFTRCNLFAND